MAVARAEGQETVSPLELFFDLVFVLAITQVTGLMSDDPTWGGLGSGMLVLAALWWSWGAYAWLTNTIDPEEGGARIAIFGAMAAALVAALAVPDVFGDDALAFGLAYLFVRVMHLWLYGLGTRADQDAFGAVLRLAPTSLAGCGLILLAAAFDGPAQYALWGLALMIDYGGPLVAGVEGWHLQAKHFTERHALIVIIALGESIVAIGVGATEGLTLGIVAAAVLGIAIAAALWWAYFDVVALVAERRLHARTGGDRNRAARDSYSYLHLPMIAGIILLALGMKKTIAHVDEPLETVPAVALCGGVALYLLAHVAFRLRNVGSLNKQRCVASVVLLALIPIATEVDALIAVLLVAAVSCGLIAYEAIRFREARDRVRHRQEVAVSP
jgi:low temperature requirement protein LtrA